MWLTALLLVFNTNDAYRMPIIIIIIQDATSVSVEWKVCSTKLNRYRGKLTGCLGLRPISYR